MEQAKLQTKTVQGNEVSILSQYGLTQYISAVSEYENNPELRELQKKLDAARFHWNLIQAKLPQGLQKYDPSLVSNALFVLECAMKNFPLRLVTTQMNLSRVGGEDKIHTFTETAFKHNKYVIDCSEGEVKILSSKKHKLLNCYGSNDIIEVFTAEKLVNTLGHSFYKFFIQGVELKSTAVLHTLFEQRMTSIFWKSIKDTERLVKA